VEVLETREWLDSLDTFLSQGGPERAGRLLQQLSLHARRAAGVNLPFTATTPYQKQLLPDNSRPFPGSQEMERRIKSLVRWNALAMVVRANKIESGIGGHISTFASAARCMKSRSITFFRRRTESETAIWCTSWATPRRHVRARLSGRTYTQREAADFRRELKKVRASPRIPTLADARLLGISHGSMDSARFKPSTRRASSLPGKSRLKESAVASSGRSWETARWTNQNLWIHHPGFARAAR